MKAMRVVTAMAGVVLLGASAQAQVFNGGLPVGYGCNGVCSTTPTPTGSIGAVPSGSSRVGFVTTNGSINTSNPLLIAGTMNGSQLVSSPFVGTAGQNLSFFFDYISADGARNFMDYAYVQLIGLTSGTTTLFTARMSLSGIAVPGFGLPGIAPGVVFTPFPVLVHPGTIFFGLGDHSGDCFAAGCGNTGWIQASYNLAANDTYRIMFGVNNMGDDPRDPYDSALLFDFGAGAGGVPTVAVTPEPASFVLLGTGLIVVFGFARRKRNQA